MTLGSGHRRTLDAVFRDPVSATIRWRDVEALLSAAGAEVLEGRGSRVRFQLGEVRATFHRPHPRKEAKPYQIRDVRQFLSAAGVKP